jgi:hypothetical protein
MEVSKEVLVLSGAAAQALVASMTTDLWHAVRGRIGNLLGRGQAEAEARQLARLDRDHSQLTTAVPAGRAALEASLAAQWSARLQDLLEENPQVIAELQALVTELASSQAAVASNVMIHNQTAIADHGSQITQSGSQSNR